MLKFGVVGTSWITDEYIKGAKDTGLWTLTAVYSRSAEKAKAYAEKHGGAHCFDDMEKMAASKTFDAVYIASPNFLHFEHCKCFLEHGKHVICEKPLCAQADKVEALQKIAADKGVIFLEAIMYMHLPQRVKLEQAVEEIGGISLARIDFSQRSSKYDEYLRGGLPNIFNPAMETGALMDIGIYCVYPALHLLGLPESVTVQSQLMASGADAQGIITMKYPDKLAVLTYSKIGQARAGSEFQGKNGTIYVDAISRLEGMELITNDGSRKQLHGEDQKSTMMSFEAVDFYQFITNPQENAAAYQECSRMSLRVSAFMEKIRPRLGIHFPSDQAESE